MNKLDRVFLKVSFITKVPVSVREIFGSTFSILYYEAGKVNQRKSI